MGPTEETYREAHRRSHRLLGSYLALWAWIHEADCVVLTRDQLLPFLGLERMWKKRIGWLMEDLKVLFPYSFTTIDSKTKVYATLYLSRNPIPQAPRKGSMRDETRCAAFGQEGLRARLVTVPPEAEIVSIMACMAHGIHDFSLIWQS